MGGVVLWQKSEPKKNWGKDPSTFKGNSLGEEHLCRVNFSGDMCDQDGKLVVRKRKAGGRNGGNNVRIEKGNGE